MKTLLVINSSGRVTRSITRRLTERFAARWANHHPGGTIIHRDVGLSSPPPVDEAWIAGAFSDAGQRTAEMEAALALSEELIDELSCAETIVIGSPIYNFGMPAQLKAYVDQVIRVGRTFEFVPNTADPYRPCLESKPVVIITSAGDGALHPGGALHHMNHLEPHLRTALGFIGLTDITFVRVGYEEFQDERLKHSLKAAEEAIDELARSGPAAEGHRAAQPQPKRTEDRSQRSEKHPPHPRGRSSQECAVLRE